MAWRLTEEAQSITLDTVGELDFGSEFFWVERRGSSVCKRKNGRRCCVDLVRRRAFLIDDGAFDCVPVDVVGANKRAACGVVHVNAVEEHRHGKFAEDVMGR